MDLRLKPKEWQHKAEEFGSFVLRVYCGYCCEPNGNVDKRGIGWLAYGKAPEAKRNEWRYFGPEGEGASRCWCWTCGQSVYLGAVEGILSREYLGRAQSSKKVSLYWLKKLIARVEDEERALIEAYVEESLIPERWEE